MRVRNLPTVETSLAFFYVHATKLKTVRFQWTHCFKNRVDEASRKGKAKPRITWRCRENCPHKCVLVVQDQNGKLDGEWELELFPFKCPFLSDVQVSFDGEQGG